MGSKQTSRWSDGMSALVVLCMAEALVLFIHFRERPGIEALAVGCLLVVAMAFFWSVLWRTRCRDVWAWAVCLLGPLLFFSLLRALVTVT